MNINYRAVSNYYKGESNRVLNVTEKHLNFEDAEAFHKFTEENPEAFIRHFDVRNGNIFAQVQFTEWEDI
ncbi:hypothetical protein [Paenibacillus sp. Y412MC10]|uniref:hypothetical protein n=1 Tax=Geobacillus sp. (strain Y412MC10) TaxID=481743 RepID=UPI0011A7E410|nr:hypothetical protein [Paenibacillus sp. Y412MC10]